MAEQERDVLVSGPSTDNEPEVEEEETPESEEDVIEPEEEETPEPEPDPSPEPEPEEVDVQRQLEAERKKSENLLKALQAERRSKQQIVPPVQPTAPDALKESVEVANAILREQEEQANEQIYKLYPELSPENDPDNSNWNLFAERFKEAKAVLKAKPRTAKEITDLAKRVMGYVKGASADVDAAAKARAEAHREALKAKAASIGGTSPSKPGKKVATSEEDQRVASRVGMNPEDYAQVKDVYGDEIPV